MKTAAHIAVIKIVALLVLAIVGSMFYDVVLIGVREGLLSTTGTSTQLGFIFVMLVALIEALRLNYFVWDNTRKDNLAVRASGRSVQSVLVAALISLGLLAMAALGLRAYALTVPELAGGVFSSRLPFAVALYALIILMDHLLLAARDDALSGAVLAGSTVNNAHRLLDAVEQFTHSRHFASINLAAIGLAFVFLAVRNGMFTKAIFGDESLDVYSAQTIANGYAPFEKYVILHPPLAYLPVSVFMRLGRILGVEDVIAARVAKLVFVLLSMVLVYHISKHACRVRLLSLFGSVLLGWSTLFVMISSRSPTKLVFMALLLTLIALIQRERWFWVGVASLALLMSWGGAFAFLPIPLAILIFGGYKNSSRLWGRFLAGFAVAVAVMLAYLYLGGVLDLFFQQYVSGFLGVVQGAVPLPGNSGVDFTPSTNETLIERLGPLPVVDDLLLFAGLPALAYLVFRRIFWRNREWSLLGGLLGDAEESPILVSLTLAIVLSLVDFQSAVDITPAIAPFVLVVVLALDGIVRVENRKWPGSKARYYLLFLIVTAALLFARAAGLGPSRYVLEGQKVAFAWASQISPDYSLQSFGNLGLQVISNRENASRIIHLGPKTLIAMRAEGIEPTQFFTEQSADFILFDNRNSINPEVVKLVEFLDGQYAVVSGAGLGGGYGQIFYREDDPNGQAIAYGIVLSSEYTLVVESDLAILRGDLEAAADLYSEIAASLPDLAPFAELQLAELSLQAGNTGEAENLFRFAARHGKKVPWGTLGAGNYFYSIGETGLAEDYYTEVLPGGTPLAFRYRVPALFTPKDLIGLSNPENIQISEGTAIVAHEYERVENGNLLLTLWWYNYGVSKRAVTVQILGLSESGEVQGVPIVFDTISVPGVGVRWSYQLPASMVVGAESLQVVLIYADESTSLPVSLEID